MWKLNALYDSSQSTLSFWVCADTRRKAQSEDGWRSEPFIMPFTVKGIAGSNKKLLFYPRHPDLVYDRRRGCLLADNGKISAYGGYGGTSVAPIKFNEEWYIYDKDFFPQGKRLHGR